jgi:ELWxxDGT repeat protein
MLSRNGLDTAHEAMVGGGCMPRVAGLRTAAIVVLSTVVLTGASPTPFLVKDINTATADSRIGGRGILGDLFYFDADSGFWRTDGAAAGTVQTTPRRIPDRTGFFSGCDGAHGCELWSGDGTDAGSLLVADIASGAGSSSPGGFTAFGNLTLFIAGAQVTDRQIWRTDGTSTGTIPVTDGTTGLAASPADLTVFDGAVFFGAGELWKTDGTPGGTAQVLDVNGTATLSDPRELVVLDDVLYFVANDAAAIHQLWRSDGTAVGTHPVTGFTAGTLGSFQHGIVEGLTPLHGRIYFRACDAAAGCELWSSDGTPEGTQMVADIEPGAGSGVLTWPHVFGDVLLFGGFQRASGAELWESDGTASGTRQVADIEPGPDGSGPHDFFVGATQVFFTAFTWATGTELWRTDGTSSGTRLVRDLSTAPKGSDIGEPVALGGLLYFRATDALGGHELWRSDGTGDGTQRVADPAPAARDAKPEGLRVAHGALWFAASDPDGGTEPWTSDGTAAGTHRVADVYPGPPGSNPAEFTAFGDAVVFAASDASAGRELWISDGTASGTHRFADVLAGPPSGGPRVLTPLGRTLLFFANESDGSRRLWRSDGTPAGTASLGPRSLDLNGERLVVAGDQAFYPRCSLPGGCELWRTDGTVAGTHLVLAQPDYPLTRDVVDLASAGPLLVFSVELTPPAGPTEIWQSDGTETGTMPLLTGLGDARLVGGAPGSFLLVECSSSSPCALERRDLGTGLTVSLARGVDANWIGLLPGSDTPFFHVFGNDSGGIWRTDGTPDGTRRVLVEDALPDPTPLGVVGDTVLMRSSSWLPGGPDVGEELWGVTSSTTGTSPTSTTPTSTTLPATIACTTGELAACDDHDACTTDICMPVTGGCQHLAPAAGSASALACVAENLRAMVGASPSLTCMGRCRCHLGEAAASLVASVYAATTASSGHACHGALAAAFHRERRLARAVNHAMRHGCLVPADEAVHFAAELRRLGDRLDADRRGRRCVTHQIDALS